MLNIFCFCTLYADIPSFMTVHSLAPLIHAPCKGKGGKGREGGAHDTRNRIVQHTRRESNVGTSGCMAEPDSVGGGRSPHTHTHSSSRKRERRWKDPSLPLSLSLSFARMPFSSSLLSIPFPAVAATVRSSSSSSSVERRPLCCTVVCSRCP